MSLGTRQATTANISTMLTSRAPPPTHGHFGGVSGHDRHKYFRGVPLDTSTPEHPLLPEKQRGVTLIQRQGHTEITPATAKRRDVKIVASERTRTIATQTVYRESESQTDPFSPDYVVPAGHDPEVLHLQKLGLSHGAGLPAGCEEVETIEWSRKMRGLQNALPSLDDTSQLERRRDLMQQQDLLELEQRDKQITKKQRQREHLVHTQMMDREKQSKERTENRVAAMAASRRLARDAELAKIQAKRAIALRKLAEQRKNVEQRLSKRDIIADYAEYGSKVFAPLKRDGVRPTMKALNEIQSLDTLDLINYMEQKINQKQQALASADVSLSVQTATSTDPSAQSSDKVQTLASLGKGPAAALLKKRARADTQLSQQLDRLDQNLRAQKIEKEAQANKPVYSQKIEKAPPRPPTPSVQAPLDDEEKTLAIILLQRLIRGRAVQNMMYEGRERRNELLVELRRNESICQHEKSIIGLQDEEINPTRQPVIKATTPLELDEVEKEEIEDGVEAVNGQILADTLDFYSKQLVRMLEHKRLHTLARRAEQIRIDRQEKELARRHLEALENSSRHYVYTQLQATHAQTVSTYLSQIIGEAVEAISSEQSNAKVEETIMDLDTEIEPADIDTSIQTLLETFLLPTVEKESTRRAITQEEKKIPNATQMALLSIFE